MLPYNQPYNYPQQPQALRPLGVNQQQEQPLLSTLLAELETSQAQQKQVSASVFRQASARIQQLKEAAAAAAGTGGAPAMAATGEGTGAE